MDHRKKILIIDDDSDTLTYLSAVLSDHHYEVDIARDGEEGFQKARKIKPDLILLDLMMPKESGVRFLSDIKQDESLREIPIIVQSAAGKITGVDLRKYLEEYPHSARRAQVQGQNVNITPQAFIEKPVDPNELIDAVQQFI